MFAIGLRAASESSGMQPWPVTISRIMVVFGSSARVLRQVRKERRRGPEVLRGGARGGVLLMPHSDAANIALS